MNYRHYSVENLFLLAITQQQTKTKIHMQLLSKHLNTSHIPYIEQLLKQHLPNVLLTECFNDDNIPFAIEVKNTEIGHLFEHILLEYLCQLKIAKGFSRAVFAGRTRWNWIRDPKGTFHIHLNCGMQDADILPIALEKTINLMKIILLTKQAPLLPQRRYFYSRNGLKIKNVKQVKKF